MLFNVLDVFWMCSVDNSKLYPKDHQSHFNKNELYFSNNEIFNVINDRRSSSMKLNEKLYLFVGGISENVCLS